MTAVEWLVKRLNLEESYHTVEQALEMEKEAKYETECYWYSRGIHAGRENKIEELKPKKD